MHSHPAFSDLPLGKNDPPYSAWGLWGNDDELGALNHLTEDVVREATSAIVSGQRFSLNWSLDFPKTPGFGRTVFAYEHKIHQVPGALILDDSLHEFNTQKSSQWDGLRHFAYQKERFFYNRTAPEKVLTKGSHTLGIHRWSEAGGIAGRGVLIDFASWAERNRKTQDMTQDSSIKYDDLMACFKEQQASSKTALELRRGDILLIRSGFTKAYLNMNSEAEEANGTAFPMRVSGVHQDLRLLEWLWTGQVAAVGGDAQGWECLPPDGAAGFLFHEVLLSGWGCPIAELLWLEDLAKACGEQKQWTFFLTSSPLNIPGGVASPANMMVIM